MKPYITEVLENSIVARKIIYIISAFSGRQIFSGFAGGERMGKRIGMGLLNMI